MDCSASEHNRHLLCIVDAMLGDMFNTGDFTKPVMKLSN